MDEDTNSKLCSSATYFETSVGVGFLASWYPASDGILELQLKLTDIEIFSLKHSHTC
jgi:hypothetical protein